MILARAISLDLREDLELAFLRMGVPSAARDYALEKLPHAQVLLTGLSATEGRFLRARSEASEAPGREEYPAFIAGDLKRRPGSALLSGRREQLERLITEARREGLEALCGALERVAHRWAGQPRELVLGSGPGAHRWALGSRTYVMGVVNVTPDSFSDGGRFLDPEAAIAQGEALALAGADLLDIGGESTRPGAPAVEVREELGRVLPVLRGLAKRVQVPLSIDTRKAPVAREALAAGAVLVNDVTGFHSSSAEPADEPGGDGDGMAKVAAEAGAACCLMHIQGTPQTMQQHPSYDDVVEEVLGYLSEGVDAALLAGVPREKLLIDPGIGFGKTLAHNLFLLRRIAELRALGLPLLVGTSRKSFLGHLVGGAAGARPADGRLSATLGSVAALAVTGGADVVRVHDVAEVKDALAVADAIRLAKDGGAMFGTAQLAPKGRGP